MGALARAWRRVGLPSPVALFALFGVFWALCLLVVLFSDPDPGPPPARADLSAEIRDLATSLRLSARLLDRWADDLQPPVLSPEPDPRNP